MVELPAGGVTGLGLNKHVTPVGRLVQLSVSGELNPPTVDVTVIVDVSELPLDMVNVSGEAEML